LVAVANPVFLRKNDSTPQVGAYTPEVRRQQQIFLVNQTPLFAAVNLVSGALLVVVFWNLVPHWETLLWYGLLIVGPSMQFLGWLRLYGRPPPTRVSGRTLERAKWWSLLIGGLWGATSLIFYMPHSIPHQMLLAVVITGMTAGMAAVLGPLPSLCARFLIACLSGLVLRLLNEGHTIHLTIAVMAFFFGFALIKGSQINFKQFSRIITFSKELEVARAHLVNAIESTNDAFAIFNTEGALVIANRRFLQWFPGMTSVSDTDSTATLYRFVEGRWVQSSLRPIPGGGFVSVHTDVTALKEREDQLVAANRQAERARQQAEEASRAKSEFLANMSHELRTPLNAIMGFSELMSTELFGPLGTPRYKEYVGDIHKSASHLLSIIGDILDLSKIESSNYKIEFERVDLREVVGWVVSLATQKKALTDGRHIEVEIDESARELMLDLRASKQILLNLVGNAMKFTPVDGRVGIRVKGDADGATRITVWDTGIGIPKDKLDWVKQPFSQFESVFHKKFHGTGLGLSISDALVRLQGGGLIIDSDEGKGTQVTVLFPPERRLDASAEAPAEPETTARAALAANRARG
jgi:signal transduction histidine kinase